MLFVAAYAHFRLCRTEAAVAPPLEAKRWQRGQAMNVTVVVSRKLAYPHFDLTRHFGNAPGTSEE